MTLCWPLDLQLHACIQPNIANGTWMVPSLIQTLGHAKLLKKEWSHEVSDKKETRCNAMQTCTSVRAGLALQRIWWPTSALEYKVLAETIVALSAEKVGLSWDCQLEIDFETWVVAFRWDRHLKVCFESQLVRSQLTPSAKTRFESWQISV